MDKNEVKQLLLDSQYNNQLNQHCSKEEFLELIPCLLTILNEETPDVFHLAIKKMYSTGLTHVPIDDWEQMLLKDSLPSVLLHVTRIMSEFDIKINEMMEEINAADPQTRNILNLIESCDIVLGSINSLVDTTLSQYNTVGSKLPSLLLCVPDIMLAVLSHCARNKSKFALQCEEFGVALKNLYSSNKLIQTSYLSLLENKIDFSDSQDSELLQECLDKLSDLGRVLLELDMFSAYAAFRTYCSVAIKYVHNLRNTLHVTPAVHAMVRCVTQHLRECREATKSSGDPLQAKKNKLLRVFLKLILDLVANYTGYLRDTHPTLIDLLNTLYNFSCEVDGEMSTTTEAAANNLVILCFQDVYFMSELLHSENSTPGFINLCVICMKKCLESQTPSNENHLALIQLVIKSFSRMEVKHFLGMLRSHRYKSAVSTLSALTLLLPSSDYNLLEPVLLASLLSGTPALCLFASDVWCILLTSGPRGLFEATTEFFVEMANAVHPPVDNFQYRCLAHLVTRCLRDVKPGSVKKMFANGTLSYSKHPVLLTLAPEHLSSSTCSTTLSTPPTLPPSHANALLCSLLVQHHLDVALLVSTLTGVQWECPCTDYIVRTLCSCLEARLVTLHSSSMKQLFQTIISLLRDSGEAHVWLSLLSVLRSIPTPVSLDPQTTEHLFETLLRRANESESDYVNQAIATYIGAAVTCLDKSVFLRVLKKSGKIALVTKYVSDHDPYHSLNQLGNAILMQCACVQPDTQLSADMEGLGTEARKPGPGDEDAEDIRHTNYSQKYEPRVKPAPVISNQAGSRPAFSSEESSSLNGDSEKSEPLSDSNESFREKFDNEDSLRKIVNGKSTSDGASMNTGETCTMPRDPTVNSRSVLSSVVNTDGDSIEDPAENNRNAIENSRISNNGWDSKIKDPIETSTNSIINSISAPWDLKTTKSELGQPSDFFGDVKARQGSLDSSQSKRIKLEDQVLVNVEIEKALAESENLLKFLSEKKCVMNAENRDRMRELQEMYARVVLK